MKLVKITSINVTIASIIFFFVINSHANVECRALKESEKILWDAELIIFGEITANDPFLVQSCIEKNKKSLQTFIDSPGGDVQAAMNIGRILRMNRKSIWVNKPSRCMSSCVLILAGAVSRSVYGKIGIHRIYSTKTGIIETDEAQKRYQKNRSEVEIYLRNMNISTSLFDAMERIPPEEIKILSAQEIEAYGLNDMDPVEQEVQNAYYADQRGISIQEYLRRKEEAKRLCQNIYKTTAKDIVDEFNCEEAVSWGLTISVYNSRIMRGSVCDEIKIKYGLESKEYNTCIREVMNGTR